VTPAHVLRAAFGRCSACGKAVLEDMHVSGLTGSFAGRAVRCARVGYSAVENKTFPLINVSDTENV
jgi:hypothetical protein